MKWRRCNPPSDEMSQRAPKWLTDPWVYESAIDQLCDRNGFLTGKNNDSQQCDVLEMRNVDTGNSKLLA